MTPAGSMRLTKIFDLNKRLGSLLVYNGFNYIQFTIHSDSGVKGAMGGGGRVDVEKGVIP